LEKLLDLLNLLVFFLNISLLSNFLSFKSF
jgi:hypothetical protein